jgi:hypothetical protein
LFVSWLLPEEFKSREVRISCANRSSIFTTSIHGDFAAKKLAVDGKKLECDVPSWVKADNNQVKDELADFISYCLRPDPGHPPPEPLLSPSEIEDSVRIIESLLEQGSRMTCGGDRRRS